MDNEIIFDTVYNIKAFCALYDVDCEECPFCADGVCMAVIIQSNLEKHSSFELKS